MGQWTHLYNNTRWKQLRRVQLKNYPLCMLCQREGRVALASVVDHITPHKGNKLLFWDFKNVQSLCYTCHNSTKQSAELLGFDKRIDMDGWPVHMCGQKR
jgi:5-methylcytosine-specific restriction protein A